MKRLLLICAALVAGLLPASAQKSEGHNAAISRNLEIFNDIYRQLDMYYVDTLSADTLIEWGIQSMLRQVDPFTVYYNQDDMGDLKQMATGKYAGIGSIIRFSKKENRVVLSEPYEDSPCQQAGLKAGDVILTIDGKDVEGMPNDRVSSMLRGEAGTTFELRVRRPGVSKPLSFHITRRNIQMPQVPYYGQIRPGIGYILLSGFTDGAAREMRHALNELRAQGVQSLVLDLRGNPGGSLTEAVDILNLFVPKGVKVVYTRGKLASTNREYYTTSEPVDTQIPIVALVDDESASAAEIVSGTLQDLDRAVIVGTRTYGKGLVQAIREVPYHGNLKLTTSRYYIPSGRCIQAYDYRHLNADGSVGVVPDSLTHLFHTAGGREVRDGGGIKPDVVVPADSLPAIVYDLVGSDVMFDYVTEYAHAHETIAPAGEFALTDADYQAFVDYAESQGFTYSRRCGEMLKMLREVAEREGYLEYAREEFDALDAKFTNDLRRDLLRFREKITPYLQDEIVKRYYYQRGGVQQQLVDDRYLETGLEILNTEGRYAQILEP